MSHDIRPFRVNIAQADLDDLADRLARTRWADELLGTAWGRGPSLEYLKELTAYWRTTYDWRKQESRINELPLTDVGWTPVRIARAFAELMRRLGYDRYGAQGGDFGAFVSPELGRIDADRVVGVHVNAATVGFSPFPASSESKGSRETRAGRPVVIATRL
jgi:hypothetical protein